MIGDVFDALRAGGRNGQGRREEGNEELGEELRLGGEER